MKIYIKCGIIIKQFSTTNNVQFLHPIKPLWYTNSSLLEKKSPVTSSANQMPGLWGTENKLGQL